MNINVLGPFEVLRNGTDVTPSAPKLRQVLALLAMHVNKVVAVERFIEELWHDNPPRSATTTLQTYIYQLRKLYGLDVSTGQRVPEPACGPVSAPTLHTTYNGYMLSLPAEAVDLQRFLQLARKGHRHVQAAELEATAETMVEALGLWRGNALTGVEVGSTLQASVVSAEELRKTVLEQQIDAELMLGRHHQLIGDLTEAVTKDPTHEAFQAKLMLALYRCGRRTDALRVFRQARQAVNDELGLEPSADLQRLHRNVLDGSPSLDLGPVQQESPFAGPREVPPPLQLPPDVPGFVGHATQLHSVQRALGASCGPAPVIVVDGAPGVGKTTFCTHVGHAIREDYPDGQLYATFDSSADAVTAASEVITELLRAIGTHPSALLRSFKERVALFRDWTVNRRVLVVLDDLVSSDQLIPFLPIGPGCAVVAASRRRLFDPHISMNVSLTPFDRETGVRMLAEALGGQRTGFDRKAAAKLAELCGGMPAALQGAAVQLATQPHYTMERLVNAMSTVDRSYWRHNQRNLLKSMRRTFDALPPTTREALLVLGEWQDPVSAELTAKLLDTSEPEAANVLEELVKSRLAVVDGTTDGTDDGEFLYRLPAPFPELIHGLSSVHEEHTHAS